MEPNHTDPRSSSSSSSKLPLPSRFQAHIEKLHKQKMKIQQLERDKLEQTQRISELEDQAKHSNQLREDQDTAIAQLRRELAGQEHEDLQAARTIHMLTRQVEVLQMTTARAEEAQRDAEADYILRHFVGEDDATGTDPSTIGELQSKLARLDFAEQQSLRQVGELEAELELLRGTADALSRELQDSKDAKQGLELELQKAKTSKRALEQELQQLKLGLETPHLQETKDVKTLEAVEDEQWKSMASVCQNLVTTLRAQVKSLTDDKQKLEHAIACCQRSADNRLNTLEQDRQNAEAESARLRTELTRLRQDLKAMALQFRKLEEENFDETLSVEALVRVAQTQAHQKEIATRTQEVEQKVAASVDTAAHNRQLVAEKNELLQQLEEERSRSKDLARSTATFKEATETAVKELQEVEIELRAINSSRDSSDAQHETVASLARLVITDLKRQQDESVDAAVASMQILHLTSSLEEHLYHLRALRETQDYRPSSICSSDPAADANVAEEFTLIKIDEACLD
ncbi:hypothetical protein JG687_00006210 [Phytophthora cactorum]|uniref:Uncharacterized protein n=1 Tax=Phytophthora cactorum TaxID=29920 RepID=A0A8T1UK45_9STRA|nr:hypothetical protein PC120_g10321 [Phytophthora cactorum]KAG3064305.1 hypothetical protein PC121_g11771 [Phytophthora cactorum]KAG3200384.1 hypothetical protein PC128_g4606 [Phytophthora cactorum]KAG4059405.1 hypothetical protein PC123_g5687 [Phytophthora cactorum]KAG6964050.1 hypothetical protein JG687_00006210 [Phytophthora cactorum]